MISREEYLKALSIVEEYHSRLKLESNKVITENDFKLRDLDISTRALNCLMIYIKSNESTDIGYRNRINLPISVLSSISKRDLLKIRNLGPNTLAEIEEECLSHGIKLPD